LILVVANNHYAYSTPTDRQFACESLVDRAHGYGVTGHEVDGTDLMACMETCGRAVDNARNGGGPQLIIARLLRLCGHGEHDDASYIDPKLKASPAGRDCLKFAEETLLSLGWAQSHDLESWREECHQQIEETVSKVQREPLPDPFQENWSSLCSQHLGETHKGA
jgi:pyruvate dehydrogenase E1 component alpha subunit/2-oxoisovalerate dehydrogenase E1 component alpha subunit